MKLKLPILFHNESTEQLEDLDLPVDTSDLDVRNVIFYKIDIIYPYIKDDVEYCIIVSSGLEFTCIYNTKQVENIIKDFYENNK